MIADNDTASGGWKIKVGLVCLSVLFTLGSIEVVLRFCGPEYYRFPNDGHFYYTNPRGYHSVVKKEGGHDLYGINVKYTDEAYRAPDGGSPAESFNRFSDKTNDILVIGDSFTFGQGVKHQDIYTSRLEKFLEQRYGRTIGVKNCGKPGYDIEEIFNSLEREFSEQAYPLVLYGFVLNDFGLPEEHKIIGSDYIDLNNGENAYNSWRKTFATLNFVLHKSEQYRLSQTTTELYLDAYRGEWAENKFKLLERMNAFIKDRKAVLIIILFPLLYDFDHYPFQEVHDKIHVFCMEKNIRLLDLLPVFSEYQAEDLWVHPIDHHPNELAHELTADAVSQFWN